MKRIFKKYFSGLVVTALIVLCISACEKTRITTNPADELLFSTDTVKFDTIFTSIGSATKFFTVRNSNTKKTIIIDKIFLAKGGQSKYYLNIDGKQGSNMSKIELAPGDSLFIFVMVNINPTADDMVEMDSIMFVSNGNQQNIKLVAFGQNVNLIDGHTLENDTIWTPNRPFLVYNSVLVAPDVTLTIQAGTNIYFHNKSGMLVQGTLKVMGEVNNRVLFTGDRLEHAYAEVPGQWGSTELTQQNGTKFSILGGIYMLAGSKYNEINNADIKNSLVGICVDTCVTPNIPTVFLRNVNVENSQFYGLQARGAHVVAENCVFANSGLHNVACMMGGEYYFTHCTLADYWSGLGDYPQLLLSNYYVSVDKQIIDRDLEVVYFGNCIIYGKKKNEILFDCSKTARIKNMLFANCLIKYENVADLPSENFVNNIYNKEPRFKNTLSPYDYELDTLSAAKDAGKLEIGLQVPFDQLGNSRIVDNKPDVGAYERQE
jgi:hypothetical protein